MQTFPHWALTRTSCPPDEKDEKSGIKKKSGAGNYRLLGAVCKHFPSSCRDTPKTFNIVPSINEPAGALLSCCFSCSRVRTKARPPPTNAASRSPEVARCSRRKPAAKLSERKCTPDPRRSRKPSPRRWGAGVGDPHHSHARTLGVGG